MAVKKRTPSKKSAARKKTKPPVHWFLRYHVALWVVVVALTALTTLVVMQLPDQDSVSEPPVHSADSNTPAQRSVHKPTHKPPQSPQTAARLYEEKTETLETRIRELDLALIQTMVVYGYDPVGIEHGNVDTRQHSGQEYHFQHLELARPQDTDGFLDSLRKNIALLVQGGELRYDCSGNRVVLAVNGVQTHDIVFKAPRRTQQKAPAVSQGDARMVIVMDDLGRSLGAGHRLADLTFPITFSVMPYESYSAEVADIARTYHCELILHLPMQPQSYPETDPGPGALFVDMQPKLVIETVNRDLSMVPGVVGANNHMGSRFTEDRVGMDAAMRVLGERNLFFLDSVTTPKSCGGEMTKKHDVPYLRRDVFLDNVRDEQAILFQLRKAQTVARKTGTCIAIGHPYPETLAALETWQEIRDHTIRLVRLRDLLP